MRVRRNKFYLLCTPLLMVLVFPAVIVWKGLSVFPELLGEYKGFPASLKVAWTNATWF